LITPTALTKEDSQFPEFAMSDLEIEILDFCEKKSEVVKKQLNKLYKYGKGITKMEETTRKQKKLMPAKLALSQIIRAIKKRDYMLLGSDSVPETA